MEFVNLKFPQDANFITLLTSIYLRRGWNYSTEFISKPEHQRECIQIPTEGASQHYDLCVYIGLTTRKI